MPTDQQVCVVLNNQHRDIVEEFVNRCSRDAECRVVFQPHTAEHLRAVEQLPKPVPLYLVVGRFSDKATAVGTLHALEYKENLSPEDERLIAPLRATGDDDYARNILFASSLEWQDPPLALASLLKASNETPLRRGAWPAAVCLLPSTNPSPPSSDDSLLDEFDSALEGRLRQRMINHRHRETRLRKAKILQVLKEGGRLRCQVEGCGFDFRQQYGELGKGYAQVHHLVPLAQLKEPKKFSLADLAVVCANCHAMIHRGGEFRSLSAIAQAKATTKDSDT